DGRGEVNGVLNAVAGTRIESDEFVALANFDGAENFDRFALSALCFDPRVAKGLNVRKSAAVKNREFEIVEFDDDVVDAHTDQRTEQMLCGGDEHALAHEACRVADFCDIAADGRNLEVVEISAAEDNA